MRLSLLLIFIRVYLVSFVDWRLYDARLCLGVCFVVLLKLVVIIILFTTSLIRSVGIRGVCICIKRLIIIRSTLIISVIRVNHIAIHVVIIHIHIHIWLNISLIIG